MSCNANKCIECTVQQCAYLFQSIRLFQQLAIMSQMTIIRHCILS